MLLRLMRIDIRPDKEDQFTVSLDGETKMVENEHQDIEFTVWTKYGVRVRSGRTRADLLRALGEVREIDGRRAVTAKSSPISSTKKAL